MQQAVRSVLKAALAALLLLPVLPSQADAIPAFARKYRVSCVLCHAPFPRLTAFGEEFAGNGFMLARGMVTDTLETGDPRLVLQRDIPLGIRLDAYVAGLSGGGDVVASDLRTPWAIKLLSGGQVTDDVAYYLYFFMSERGEIAGLEDAYLQFNDVLGSGVDVIAGQFQVSDPLYKRELRLEYEDYMPYRVRVGDVRADLTYERGFMAITSPWEKADLFVQVVNGRGLDHADASTNYDTDSGKNFGFRLSQDLDFVRVGGFLYTGHEKAGGLKSTLRVFGPDFTLPLGDKVEVNFQYLYRKDGNPFFLDACTSGDDRCSFGTARPLETEVDSYMGEMLFFPQGVAGNWSLTGLYNRVEANSPIFTLRAGEDGFLDRYESVGLSASYARATNLRLLAEVSRDLTLKRTRFIAGVVSAF